jgi:hypothetical protein
MKQTRQLVRTVKQSIYLDVYGPALFQQLLQTLTTPLCDLGLPILTSASYRTVKAFFPDPEPESEQRPGHKVMKRF